MFPYHNAKEHLIKLIENSLPSEFKKHSEFILNLHLREDSLAMPIMTLNELKRIRAMVLNGAPIEEVQAAVRLEDPASRRGVFRVLVRTHLNRGGMNNVSEGNPDLDKTASPRILNFADTINLNENTETTSKEIITSWLEFAHQYRSAVHKDQGLYYDDRAIAALERIHDQLDINEIVQDPEITAPQLSKNLNINIGWCRIVLGLLTGLEYLHSRKWNVYEKVSKNDLSYDDVHKFIKDGQSNIKEYGYALAGSFFADLGASCFVKDDIHVRACVTSIDETLNSPRARVEAVIKSAQNLSIAPRILDKLMYIACSGNLYLLGVKLPNSKSIKDKFVNALPRLL